MTRFSLALILLLIASDVWGQNSNCADLAKDPNGPHCYPDFNLRTFVGPAANGGSQYNLEQLKRAYYCGHISAIWGLSNLPWKSRIPECKDIEDAIR